jgi:hypothetical protein
MAAATKAIVMAEANIFNMGLSLLDVPAGRARHPVTDGRRGERGGSM